MSSNIMKPKVAENEPEILLAIATAFHLEQNFAEGRQHLTFNRERGENLLWGYTGKLQRLTSRKNIHIRSRK